MGKSWDDAPSTVLSPGLGFLPPLACKCRKYSWYPGYKGMSHSFPERILNKRLDNDVPLGHGNPYPVNDKNLRISYPISNSAMFHDRQSEVAILGRIINYSIGNIISLCSNAGAEAT